MNSVNFQPNLILIYGLAREGLSSYKYLRAKFTQAPIVGLDDRLAEDALQPWQEFLAKDSLLHLNSAQEFSENISSYDLSKSTLLCKSAGVPAENPLLQTLIKHQCFLSSNTEIFFQEIKKYRSITTIGITGTKGKSTTAALIGHVLNQGKQPVFVAGNIGKPPLDLIEDISIAITNQQSPFIVLELSSHQLRELSHSPHIAVLLNITPEHLDYYPSFKAYWQAKAQITTNQKEGDFLLFNPQHAIPTEIAKMSQAKPIHISEKCSVESTQSDVCFDDHHFYLKQTVVMNRVDLNLLGSHNAFNALPAIWIGDHFRLSQAEIKKAFQTFRPLDHRLQIVEKINEVLYVNDSQATTPEASMAGIKAFEPKPIILIAGGSSKGVSFAEYAQFLTKSSVKNLILFPPEGERIKQAIYAIGKHKFELQDANSMQEAIQIARQKSQKGDVVLLSPACASFGLFSSYIDRGNQFIEFVRK